MTTWTSEQLANYETAVETIGNVIAFASRDIAQERRRARPNKARIAHLVNWQRQLDQVRRSLRVTDDKAVQEAIDTYGKIVRERLRAMDDKRHGLAVPLRLVDWAAEQYVRCKEFVETIHHAPVTSLLDEGPADKGDARRKPRPRQHHRPR